MLRTQISCYIEYCIGYTTTCFDPGYWPSSGCSQFIDQLYNMRRVYSGRGELAVDEISSYNIEKHGLVTFSTNVYCIADR